MRKSILNFQFSIFNFEGFTLIELIVVFSVIAILSTVGVASFVTYSRNQTLQQATNDLVTVLNTAKAKSTSQVKPFPQCGASAVLNGYSVSINVSAGTYTLNVVCQGATIPLSTTRLPANVSFNLATGNPPTTTTNVFFSLLTSAVIGTGNIVLSSSGRTKTVTITSTGGIQ